MANKGSKNNYYIICEIKVSTIFHIQNVMYFPNITWVQFKQLKLLEKRDQNRLQVYLLVVISADSERVPPQLTNALLLRKYLRKAMNLTHFNCFNRKHLNYHWPKLDIPQKIINHVNAAVSGSRAKVLIQGDT